MFVAKNINDLGKVCEMPENEAAIERLEKIVLVAWQDVAGLKLPDDLGEATAAIRKGNADNGEVDVANGWVDWCSRDTAGLDVNALSLRFDNEGKRFAHGPIGRPNWWAGMLWLLVREWNGPEKTIVLRRENADPPWSKPLHGTRVYRETMGGVDSERFDKTDGSWSRNEAGVGEAKQVWHIEQMIEMCVSDEDGIGGSVQVWQGRANASL